jgi:DNA polymerase-1
MTTLAEPTTDQLFKMVADAGIKVDVEGVARRISAIKAQELTALEHLDEVTDFRRLLKKKPEPFITKKTKKVTEFAPHFNPRSKKHLTVWFEDQGLDVPHSFALDVLEQRMPYEVFQAVESAKRYRKFWGDLQTLRNHVSMDGRMHVEWTVAKTGRYYTGAPSIQTMAKVCREYLVPEEGNCFYVLDWNQQELRFLAHISQEPRLLEVFEKGADPHIAAYMLVTGQEPSVDPEMYKQQRDLGKMLNYALIYGMDADGLGGRLRIPNDVAQTLINKYLAAYPKLAEWRSYMYEMAERTSFVETMDGHRIELEVDPTDRGAATKLRRMVVNYTVQGTAARQLQAALRRVHGTGNPRIFASVRMLIHDAFLLEVPKGDVGATLARIVQLQMQVPFCGVTIPTEMHGPAYSWAEAMSPIEDEGVDAE